MKVIGDKAVSAGWFLGRFPDPFGQEDIPA
jgi:hypothetical protein